MAWVLIVDDDEPIRESLQDALRDAGYAIVKVADGEDALDVLRATPYHAVVLLDLMMPGMNGRSVLHILDNDPALAHRHAWIVMSADHAGLGRIPEDQRERLALILIKKPFDMEELLATVAQQAERLPVDTPEHSRTSTNIG
ncbi:MAG TPA: response regulator [Ktedonobacterales bacterium]|nr:response regulator [Ktedonobacterales bacterium]